MWNQSLFSGLFCPDFCLLLKTEDKTLKNACLPFLCLLREQFKPFKVAVKTIPHLLIY